MSVGFRFNVVSGQSCYWVNRSRKLLIFPGFFFFSLSRFFLPFIFGFVDPGKGKLRNSPGFPSLGLFCSLLAANEF